MSSERILIIDDELEVAENLREMLALDQYAVDKAHNAAAAEALLMKNIYDVAVIDLRMPDVNGLEMLARCRKIDPAIAALMLTAYGTPDSEAQAFKLGVKDFLTKPVKRSDLLAAVERGLKMSQVVREARNLRHRLGVATSFESVIGRSDVVLETLALARKAATSDLPVVVQGETGTGKGMFAEVIHAASRRADGPFVTSVIAAGTDQLQKGALFGHVKGAFTDAHVSRRGYFQEAHQGTLFLDEIGEIGAGVQVALLRAVEGGVIRPEGAESDITVDTRIISATNLDLRQEVQKGNFREDLFYRLGGVFINVPPLRERQEDILSLANHFIARAVGPGADIPQLDEQSQQLLCEYRWPGNVRELKSVIERALVLADGLRITAADCLLVPIRESSDEFDGYFELPLDDAHAKFNKRYLERLMTVYKGDTKKVSEYAGKHVTTIRRLIRELGISKRGVQHDR